MAETMFARKLCDACQKRIFGGRDRKTVDLQKCWLCEGLCREVDKFADMVIEKLKEYEFETFSIGTKIDFEILEKEEKLKNFIGENFRDIKTWLNRKIGRKVEMRTGKKFVFSDYDINVIVDTRFDYITLQIKPVYLYARYLKFVRGIPQTKWPCRICNGIGCRKCNYTGKQYRESVEEIISKKILEAFDAEEESFHGCGREDIDVRMVGTGRPFVLELKNPKRRKINLNSLEKEVNEYGKNKIMIKGLRYSDKKEISRLKSENYEKVYHAKIACEREIQEKKLKEVLSFFEGKIIKQKTPFRVSHRRADKVRERKIYECKLLWLKGKEALIKIRAQSGTYIKELVSGDEGRTKPSISEILGSKCEVKKLDVVRIEGD